MDLTSAQPFWPLQDGLPAVYPTLKSDLNCEVLVLGGGITGAFIAHHLVSEGLDVALVDKRDIGRGSTAASTALLEYEIDIPLTDLAKMIGQREAEDAYRICRDSIGKIEAIVREMGECGFRRKKSVYLASRKRDAALLREECAARKKAGIAVEYLDERTLSSMFSFQRPAALLSQDAAEVDPYQLTHELLAAASKRGLRVFERTEVVKHQGGETETTSETDRGFKVTARHVVFATGYESVEFLPRCAVTLKSTFAFVSRPLTSFEGWWEQCLIWETARPYLYLRTTPDGRAIVGGEDISFHNPAHRDRRLPKKAGKLAACFREMFPKMDLEVAYSWAGTFAETKDGLAYIGSVPEFPRYLFALGFGGNGITFGAVAAEIIRDQLLQRPNAAARLFRFDR
ncbi:MAG TPA: FAD-dependent oxidoreductase [Chthoniobacterales bacterium]|nr:FAD-dependent oxidoreductase [Chthoniobacterales bacterium]